MSSFQNIQKLRRLSSAIGMFTFCAIMTLGTMGCTESNDQAAEEAREAVPTVQEPPAGQEAVPDTPAIPDIKEDGPGAETTTADAKGEAQEQLFQARQAVGQAEQLLQQAPRGKDSDLALSALQRDLTSARALLQTGQEHFEENQFQLAHTQAQEAKEKASAVSQHVEQAINTGK